MVNGDTKVVKVENGNIEEVAAKSLEVELKDTTMKEIKKSVERKEKHLR